MNKEVIPVTEIPKFQSRAEEFFPIQWYKEMLNNIYKHAAAREVWISVSLQNNELCLQVSDDGKGFLADRQSHRNGLKNLYQRSSKWKGTISIRSQQQKGTSININVPLVE